MITSIDDYERVLYFLSQIQGDQNNFRHSVLQLLHDLFSYNHLTFFLTDEKGYLVNPVVINMSDKLMNNYIEHYFQTDIFHPASLDMDKLLGKTVLTISDIMPFEEFEKTDYCRDLLPMDNLYYELALPLKSQNKMIGGIGILNTKDQGDFTQRDIILLNYIGKHISMNLNIHLKISKLQNESQIYLDSMRQLPVGVIILNNRQQILSNNEIAYELCKNMDSNRLHPVAHVVQMVLSKLSTQSISTSSYLETMIGSVNVKIVPFIVPGMNNQLENYYALYLTPVISTPSVMNELIVNHYKLTEREMEIAKLVVEGLNNKEIAEKLVISSHTVKTHIENIFSKLGVDRRAAIAHKLNA